MDLEMLKEIPGYKAILKAVLKSQIQMLVEQLSSQTEEESIILTASLSDGTLYHLGSTSGKDFLEGREEIKSQFLFHCLNRKTRSPEPTRDQIYMPPVTSPSDVVYPQERRPAKKPRRTLPLASGRGRKPRSQIQAGASNLKRPRYSPTATITRPVEESAIPGYTDIETRTVPGPDLVTVKAENFELNIDLNDKSAKPNEAPVDNNLSDIMDIVNQPKKTVPVPTSLTQSFDSDQGDLDMNTSVGEVRNPASEHEGDTVTNVKVNLVPVKVEAPDDFEITGMEPGASQDMYGVPGPSGDMGSPSWAPMGSGGMETESFASGADGQSEESFDYSSQSSGNTKKRQAYFLPQPGIYSQAEARENNMVQLVDGHLVYLYQSKIDQIKNSSVDKKTNELCGKRLARRLMGVFFSCQEMLAGTLAGNSGIGGRVPLNPYIIDAIIDFATQHSKTSRGAVRDAMSAKLTAARCNKEKRQKCVNIQ